VAASKTHCYANVPTALGWQYTHRLPYQTDQNTSLSVLPQLRAATDAEVTEQIRILRAGINQFRQQTGGAMIYNSIPADNSINEGTLFGRF